WMAGSAMRVTLELLLQSGLHRWPLAVQDGEADRIAQAAVAMAHVLAQDALLLCAQPRDGGTRCGVERAGVEADAGAAQRLERMAEQRQLGVGVQAGALHRARIPGVADAHARGLGQQFVVAGAAGDTAGGVADDEDQLLARRLLRQRALQPRPDVFGPG